MPRYRVVMTETKTSVEYFDAASEDEAWKMVDDFDWSFAEQETLDEQWEMEEVLEDIEPPLREVEFDCG